MYAREYPASRSGTVRAFEDAYKKEDILRRNAASAGHPTCTGRAVTQAEPTEEEHTEALSERRCAVPDKGRPEECETAEKEKSCGLKKLFGGMEGGDLLLLLLIVFFLFDSDKENDSLIPLLLGVLLLF